MKLLGLIGGTSWHATEVYYRLINEKSADHMGNAANPPLLMYSQNIAIMRTKDPKIIIPSYTDIVNKLKGAGAEKIMLCANTPHMIVEAVEEATGMTFLHIADSTAKEAKRLGVQKLGLLGTLTTMQKPFLKKRLKDRWGMEVVLPAEQDQHEVFRRISEELTRGIFKDETRSFYLKEIDKLVEAGAEAIILGCTELPILMEGIDYQVPLLDTTKLHAYDAVDYIFSKD